tara:strand:- start:420 stop:614 length:195 start_codon:yes stop_codon:yes gene_type:complete
MALIITPDEPNLYSSAPTIPSYFSREEYDVIVKCITHSQFHQTEDEQKLLKTILNKVSDLTEAD